MENLASTADARAKKAHKLLQDGDKEGAIAQLNKALFLQPNSPLLYVQRGEVYVQMLDFKSAI